MKRLSLLMVVAWFVLACTSPDIKGVFPISIRLEDAALLVMLALMLLRFVISPERLSVPRLVVILSSFVLFLTCISLTVFLLNMFSNINLPDTGTTGLAASAEVAKEYFRFIKYILIAIVFSSLTFDAWRALVKTLLFCCVVVVAIQIMQYLQIPGVNETIALIYGRDNMLFVGYATDWAIAGGYFAAGSIFGSANVAGAFLIMPFILLLILVIKRFRTGIYSSGQKAVSLFMLLIVFMGMYLSQSRSALISAVMGSFTSLVCIRKSIGLKPSAIFAISSFVVAAVIIFSFIFSGQMNKFGSKFRSGFGQDSLARKQNMVLEQTVDLNNQQILLGKGPGLAIMVDSEFGYILTWYGLFGILGYYVFYASLFSATMRGIDDDFVRSAFLGIIIAFIVGALPSSFFLNIRVFPVFLAMLSVAMRQKKFAETQAVL